MAAVAQPSTRVGANQIIKLVQVSSFERLLQPYKRVV
jgi:hypothetical protein